MISFLFVVFMVVVCVIMLFDTMPNKCTGDCNEGRNCTCKDQ